MRNEPFQTRGSPARLSLWPFVVTGALLILFGLTATFGFRSEVRWAASSASKEAPDGFQYLMFPEEHEEVQVVDSNGLALGILKRATIVSHEELDDDACCTLHLNEQAGRLSRQYLHVTVDRIWGQQCVVALNEQLRAWGDAPWWKVVEWRGETDRAGTRVELRLERRNREEHRFEYSVGADNEPVATLWKRRTAGDSVGRYLFSGLTLVTGCVAVVLICLRLTLRRAMSVGGAGDGRRR